MSTTWPPYDATDAVSGKNATRQTPQAIWDRLICAMCSGTGVNVSGSTASGTWASIDTFLWEVPTICGMDTTWVIHLYVHATPSGGSGDLRLANGATKGDTVPVASENRYDLTLTVDSSWIDSQETYTIEGQTAGSSIAIDVDDLLMNLRLYD